MRTDKNQPNRSHRLTRTFSHFKLIKRYTLATYINSIAYVLATILYDSTPTVEFDKKNRVEMTEEEKYGDRRERVPDHEQRTSFIYRIKILLDDGKHTACTGAAISPNTLLTAAHCFNDKNIALVFIDRGNVTKNFVVARKFLQYPQYKKNFGDDIGLVIANQNFSKQWLQPEPFPKNKKWIQLNTAGFPYDKQPGTMWKATYFYFAPYEGNIIISPGKSAGGESGSPVYETNRKNGPIVGKTYGVLVAGGEGVNNEQYTFFTPLNENFLKWLKEEKHKFEIDKILKPPFQMLNKGHRYYENYLYD